MKKSRRKLNEWQIYIQLNGDILRQEQQNENDQLKNEHNKNE